MAEIETATGRWLELSHPNEVVREVIQYLIPRLFRIEKALHELKEKVMSVQDQIDQETQKVAALTTAVQQSNSALKDLTDEVSLLKAQIAAGSVPNDFTKLDAALDNALSIVNGSNTNYPDPGPQGSTNTGATGGTGAGGATGATGATGTDGSANSQPANS